MIYIGCHLSSTKGYLHMGKDALAIGANTFAFFTRNPRGGKAKDIDPEDVAAFLKLAEENNFGKLLHTRRIRLIPARQRQGSENLRI